MLNTYFLYMKIALLIAMFFAGYYLKGIQTRAGDDKAAHDEITLTTKELTSNNKIDTDYNKQIVIIDTAADNSRIEVSHEEDASCNIPLGWMRALSATSR